MNATAPLNPDAPSPQKEQQLDEARPQSEIPVQKVDADSGAMSDKSTGILTAEQWLNLPLEIDEEHIVFGSPAQAVVRTLTKNLIEGPEKSFKTSFMLRLTLAESRGVTVYSSLPVLHPRKILYIHGELSRHEIKERTQSAIAGLTRPLENFFQERDPRVHLIETPGQRRLRQMIEEVRPDDLVLDPWQSFIAGCDENEFKEVSRACAFVDKLIEDYSLTVHIATHTGKDRKRGTRGHSVLAGWRDTLTKLDRAKGQGRVTVTVEPRWAAPPDPFTLRFDQGTLVEDGFQISPLTKQAEAIRKVVKDNGGKATREIIGQTLRLSTVALRQALKRTADSGAITVVGEDVTL